MVDDTHSDIIQRVLMKSNDFDTVRENDNDLREEIGRILEERFKHGTSYYDNYLFGGKLSPAQKKKNMRKLKSKLRKEKRKYNTYSDPVKSFVRRQKGGKIACKKNPWIAFLSQYRKLHPELKGKEVMKMASLEYKKCRTK